MEASCLFSFLEDFVTAEVARESKTCLREYILTVQERDIIRQYMEFDRKLEGFTTLLYRCRIMECVESDRYLVIKLLKKAGKTSDNRGSEIRLSRNVIPFER